MVWPRIGHFGRLVSEQDPVRHAGLGLPVVRRTRDSPGGKLTVIRHERQGTTFSLELPAVAWTFAPPALRTSPVREPLVPTFGPAEARQRVRARPTTATKITLTQLRLLAFAGSGAETGSVAHWSQTTAAGVAARETSVPHMPIDMTVLTLEIGRLRDGPSVPGGARRRAGTIP